MRAPEIVREFFKWRWATCVTLILGSLAFVALALLLIPGDLGSTRIADLQRATLESSARAPSAAIGAPNSTARTAVSSVPAPVPVALPAQESAPVELTRARSTPAPQTAPADFASNVSDRADRPTRPHERSQ